MSSVAKVFTYSVTKLRTQILTEVAAEILFACDSICCICGEQGKAAQIHHLDEDPNNHRIGNLSVLCLTCYNQTQTRLRLAQSIQLSVAP